MRLKWSHWGGDPDPVWLGSLGKEAIRTDTLNKDCMESREKMAIYKPRRGTEEINPDHTTLSNSLLQNCEGMHFWCKPSSVWHFVMALNASEYSVRHERELAQSGDGWWWSRVGPQVWMKV